MKLITKEIEKLAKKYPLYSQDSKGDDAVVFVKFFNPCGAQTWYITEMEITHLETFGNKQIIEGTAFGYVDGVDYPELGYIDLEELFAIKGVMGLGIERDMYFPKGVHIGDVKRG